MSLILILGSKPKSLLPNIKVDKIYSANAACEKADKYLSKFPDTKHTCIVGVKQLLYEDSVKTRILKSRIDMLITRGISNLENLDLNFEVLKLSTRSQLEIQSKVFRLGLIDLIIGEFMYEENFSKKIKHIFNSLRFNLLTGSSTGFFSIIYALIENPNSEILISGIGMTKGSHFYQGSSRGFTERANVDRYLIGSLKKHFKIRLKSLDKDFCETFSIKYWEGNRF